MSRQERRAAERLQLKEQRKQLRGQNPQAVSETVTTNSAQPSATSNLSEARLSANRANAKLSTGPTSQAGRANSSQNSFKHGLYSRQLTIPGENPAELAALKAALRAEHQPGTVTEEILVNEMAEHYWRLRRARLAEANLLQKAFLEHEYKAIHRVMSSAERSFHKALKSLLELQKERRSSRRQQPADGFVSQESPSRRPEPAGQPESIAAPTVSSGFVSQCELDQQLNTQPQTPNPVAEGRKMNGTAA